MTSSSVASIFSESRLDEKAVVVKYATARSVKEEKDHGYSMEASRLA